jgi:hypothetical protein
MGIYTRCQNLFASHRLKRRVKPEHRRTTLEYYSPRKANLVSSNIAHTTSSFFIVRLLVMSFRKIAGPAPAKAEAITQEALEGFGDFKVGGQIIRTVRYADDLVLLAKDETVL